MSTTYQAPIRVLIVQRLAQLLDRIKIANGYKYDVDTWNIYRERDLTDESPDSPVLSLNTALSEESWESDIAGITSKTLFFQVDGLLPVQSGGGPAADQAAYLAADIEKAIMTPDTGLSSWIIYTSNPSATFRAVGQRIYAPASGGNIAGCVVNFELVYRTLRADPYSK